MFQKLWLWAVVYLMYFVQYLQPDLSSKQKPLWKKDERGEVTPSIPFISPLVLGNTLLEILYFPSGIAQMRGNFFLAIHIFWHQSHVIRVQNSHPTYCRTRSSLPPDLLTTCRITGQRTPIIILIVYQDSQKWLCNIWTAPYQNAHIRS